MVLFPTPLQAKRFTEGYRDQDTSEYIRGEDEVIDFNGMIEPFGTSFSVSFNALQGRDGIQQSAMISVFSDKELRIGDEKNNIQGDYIPFSGYWYEVIHKEVYDVLPIVNHTFYVAEQREKM